MVPCFPQRHAARVQHIAVLDRQRDGWEANQAFFNEYMVPLSKTNNPVFWYDVVTGMWFHPSGITFHGVRLRVVLNLAVANDVPLPSTGVRWSMVQRS